MMDIDQSEKEMKAFRGWQLNSPVFIVSTGRSGTTTLTQILQMHPDVCCLNEAKPALRTEGCMTWSGYYSLKRIEQRIRLKREKLISQITQNRFVYIEGTPPASHLINMLYSLFNARFVHLFTDGREFVRRAADKGWHEKSNPVGEFLTMLRRRFLLGIMGGRKIDRRMKPPSDLKTQIEKLAWLWVTVNEVIIHQMSALPENFRFSLKLEDINEDELVRLHEYIGIKVYPEVLTEMLEFLKKQLAEFPQPSFRPYDEWNEHEKKRFGQIAGDMMNKLGYDLNI